MTDETRSRIVIEFTDPHHVELSYDGPITPYMMHGAAGVLASQADYGIRESIEAASAAGRVIQRVQTVPTDIRR